MNVSIVNPECLPNASRNLTAAAFRLGIVQGYENDLMERAREEMKKQGKKSKESFREILNKILMEEE